VRIDHRIPGALIGVVGASVAVSLLHLDARGVTTVGAVASGLPRVAVPTLDVSEAVSLLRLALLVAVVCIMQTSAVARSFPPTDGSEPEIGRDLGAVGVGSILAAFIGGFPVNASPPRTALCTSAGGRSQLSGLIAVGVIIGLLVFASGLLAYVPQAALAGILVFVATHIFRVGVMRHVLGRARVEFLLLVVTAIAIVVLPIVDAVMLGIVLSVLHGVYLVARPAAGLLFQAPQTTIWWTPEPGRALVQDPEVLVFGFAAPLLFMNAHYFRRRLEGACAGRPVPRLFVLEASGIADIDFTGGTVLQELVAALRGRGIVVALARLESPRAQAAAERLGVIETFGQDAVFMSVAQAVAWWRGAGGESRG
jgi:MFS superfamily sulfate permease-like transporter